MRYLVLSLLALTASCAALTDPPDRSTTIALEPAPASQRFAVQSWGQDTKGTVALLSQRQLLLNGDGEMRASKLCGRPFSTSTGACPG